MLSRARRHGPASFRIIGFRRQEEEMKLAWVTTISISALALLMGAGSASAASMDKLVADAKAEGQLTVIALPHDWCGYGAVIDGFKAKYGLTVNELNPDAGSGDEIEAIKANKGNTGPQAPDVVDVGLELDPRQREGCRGILVWRLLRRAGVRDQCGHREEVAGRLAGPAGLRLCELGRPRRRSARVEPSDPGRLRGWIVAGERQGRQGWRSGVEVLRRAQQEGQFRAGHRQARPLGPGRHADHYPLGLQRPRRSRYAEGQSEGRSRGAQERRGRRRLCPGHQRLRAPSERCQALDGVSLFRRGPAHLARRLLSPDPVPGPRETQEGVGRAPGEAAAGGRL